MKSKLYCIQDTVALCASAIFHQVSDVVAIRTFKAAVANPSTGYSSSPGDYVLTNVGEFDDETCVLTPCTPRMICNGSSVTSKE